MVSKKPKKENLKRALKYALSLVAFQEVGMGEDKNLQLVRETAHNLMWLCKDETGIELSSYPTDFIKENKKEVLGLLPFTLIKLKRNRERK